MDDMLFAWTCMKPCMISSSTKTMVCWKSELRLYFLGSRKSASTGGQWTSNSLWRGTDPAFQAPPNQSIWRRLWASSWRGSTNTWDLTDCTESSAAGISVDLPYVCAQSKTLLDSSSWEADVANYRYRLSQRLDIQQSLCYDTFVISWTMCGPKDSFGT